MKNHFNLLGFFNSCVVVCVFPCQSQQMDEMSKHPTSVLPCPWPAFSHCTQNGQRSQAEATVNGALFNQDVITENIHYKALKYDSPFSDMERISAWHTSQVASQLLCSRMYPSSTVAFSSHPDVWKPHSLSSLCHHSLITRSKQSVLSPRHLQKCFQV